MQHSLHHRTCRKPLSKHSSLPCNQTCPSNLASIAVQQVKSVYLLPPQHAIRARCVFPSFDRLFREPPFSCRLYYTINWPTGTNFSTIFFKKKKTSLYRLCSSNVFVFLLLSDDCERFWFSILRSVGRFSRVEKGLVLTGFL